MLIIHFFPLASQVQDMVYSWVIKVMIKYLIKMININLLIRNMIIMGLDNSKKNIINYKIVI